MRPTTKVLRDTENGLFSVTEEGTPGLFSLMKSRGGGKNECPENGDDQELPTWGNCTTKALGLLLLLLSVRVEGREKSKFNSNCISFQVLFFPSSVWFTALSTGWLDRHLAYKHSSLLQFPS